MTNAQKIMSFIFEPTARLQRKWDKQREDRTKIISFLDNGYLTPEEAEKMAERYGVKL